MLTRHPEFCGPATTVPISERTCGRFDRMLRKGSWWATMKHGLTAGFPQPCARLGRNMNAEHDSSGEVDHPPSELISARTRGTVSEHVCFSPCRVSGRRILKTKPRTSLISSSAKPLGGPHARCGRQEPIATGADKGHEMCDALPPDAAVHRPVALVQAAGGLRNDAEPEGSGAGNERATENVLRRWIMTAGKAEFHAGGVGLVASASEATGTLVRRLGAFERLYQRRQQKNTMHFCVVAELADDLDPFTLAAALHALQQRHPLLNVYIEDGPQAGPGFYRPASVAPVPITVVDAETGHTWRDLVAEELTCPFDASFAPMIRVVLLRSGPTTPAAIILTVDHAIADGLSAGYMLRDLFCALNGHQLEALPVPVSQEERIGALLDAQPVAAPAATNGQAHRARPPWLATPSTIRPFDGAVPDVSAIAFDDELTRRLFARARTECTTVHAALVSAMSRVILESGRGEFVRTLTPVECRSQIGVGGDVCLYFTATRTVLTREQLTDLWRMARVVGDQLASARSLPALVARSADTEDFLIAGLSFEAQASNLDVLDMGTPETVRPLAIWGPATLVQVKGELSSGICTFNGQLRIVSASHDPLPGYLDRVRDILDAAC